jgi:hypothetical protein
VTIGHRNVVAIRFRITGGLKHGWIQEPHTYEVTFSDGSMERVEAMCRAEVERRFGVVT